MGRFCVCRIGSTLSWTAFGMGRNAHFPCRHYQTSATFDGSNPNAHCGTKGQTYAIKLIDVFYFEDNFSINQQPIFKLMRQKATPSHGRC